MFIKKWRIYRIFKIIFLTSEKFLIQENQINWKINLWKFIKIKNITLSIWAKSWIIIVIKLYFWKITYLSDLSLKQFYSWWMDSMFELKIPVWYPLKIFAFCQNKETLSMSWRIWKSTIEIYELFKVTKKYSKWCL